MAYVDGFLIPVPDARKDDYKAHEKRWWPFFRDRGALSLMCCWGDDVPTGKQTDFMRAVQATPGETVVFAWLTWPDKATRNKAHADMQMTEDMAEMPFDGTRMVYGGFVPVVSLEARSPDGVDGAA